jgi:CheY-like chemotaxis protein
MYREYLQHRGYRVATAATGEDAITAALAECPSVILMDVQMPTMSGSEALHILRSHEAFVQVPIVALTAHAMDAQRRYMLLQGFDEVIAKPCLPDDLVTAIERLLHGKRAATP